MEFGWAGRVSFFLRVSIVDMPVKSFHLLR